ncbi:hypothetical protein ACYJW8_13590 [Frateuria aurantia]
MRYHALADEFENMVQAVRLGLPTALTDVGKRLRRSAARREAELMESGGNVDVSSYWLGALDAVAELFLVTADRADRTAAMQELRGRDADFRVLRELGRWAERSRADHAFLTAGDHSQKALATAAKVDASALSRTILPNLLNAGFARKHKRGRISRIEIAEAGVAALDQLDPAWRVVEATAVAAGAQVVVQTAHSTPEGMNTWHMEPIYLHSIVSQTMVGPSVVKRLRGRIEPIAKARFVGWRNHRDDSGQYDGHSGDLRILKLMDEVRATTQKVKSLANRERLVQQTTDDVRTLVNKAHASHRFTVAHLD